jgi:GxxExxY protein
MRPSDLTPEIIGAAIKLHRKLGPGLLESAYEACLAYELENLGLRVERQKPVPLVYESIKLDCGFRADLVVEGRVVVELKCKEVLHPVDEAQLLSHLRLLNIPIGLLINFHVVLLKDGQADGKQLPGASGRTSLTAKLAKEGAKVAKKAHLLRNFLCVLRVYLCDLCG